MVRAELPESAHISGDDARNRLVVGKVRVPDQTTVAEYVHAGQLQNDQKS